MSVNERRKLNPLQILHALAPAAVLALLSWIALQVVDIKADIPAIKVTVAQIRQDLLDHNMESKALALRNSVDHHRSIGMVPCNGCHAK